MTTNLQGTVIGVFETHEHARKAVHDLKQAGFGEDQIGVASTNRDTIQSKEKGTADEGDESYAGEGALTGVAAGAGIGALWGLGILAGALPAIGPAIAGGTLAALLSSAAAGAAAAGLAGALVGLGIPKDEAEFYEGEVRAGKTIVTVNAGSRAADARSILQSHGGYDMSSRVSGTMSERDQGSAIGAPPVHDVDVTGRPSHTSVDVPVDRDVVTGEPTRIDERNL